MGHPRGPTRTPPTSQCSFDGQRSRVRACPFRTAPRSPSGGTAPPPAIIASPTRAIVFPSGPKYRYIYAKTRKLAAEKLTKAMADRNGGIVFDDENLTVSDFLDVWLSDCVKDTIRVSTFERYKGIADLHISPALGRLRLKALTPAHVQGFYRGRLDSGLSPATVQKIHVVLHRALSQAVKWSLRSVTEAATARARHRRRCGPSRRKRLGSCWTPQEATVWRPCGYSPSTRA